MPLLLVLALVLLAGCGGTAARTPGTVIMALDVPPLNLDPRIGTDATSERLIQLLFCSLVKKSRDSAIEPDLATHWEIPDPLTYIFHLRSGVVFHDGRTLTSKDVLYTFRSLLDGSLQTPKAGTFRLIDSIEGPDAQTVVFKLKQPFAPFLWNLARGGVGIIPEGSGPEVKDLPIGTGPFKFIRHIPDEEVVIARNENYYGQKPHLDTVRFKIIPEAIVRALEIRKGSVDIALNVLPPDMVVALEDHDSLEILQAPGTNYQYITFNLRDPLFADIRVRKALAHAINREEIVKYLFRGQARLASGVIPPGNWAYAGDVRTYDYNPQRARELLSEAGQPNLAFTFRTSTDETTKLLAAVFQQQFREIGVHMDIRSNEAATFAADLEKGNFQAFSRRWVGGNNDPDIFNLIFHSSMTPPAGANRSFYKNPEMDQLIDLGRRETDLGKRSNAYREIQRIAAEEVPYISLWYMDNVAVFSKRIKNMELYPAGDYDFLANIQVQ
jgi:peptide/nickel transport system substrate-binding protein